FNALDSIAGLLSNRRAVAELERAHRRDPAQADTGGRAQAVDGDFLVLSPYVADVHPREPPQRTVVARARNREIELAVDVEAPVAANVRADHVHGAERALVEGAHRAQ